jgi:S1-C subfamily serine protease
VLDLKGNVVGLNVARSDRTRNFALPSARVAEAVAKLLAQEK